MKTIINFPRAMQSILLVGLLAAPALAEETPSTWLSLTSDTLVAARIPNGRAFRDAFVENTKFGSVVFSDDRLSAVQKVLLDGDSGDRFLADLAEVGFGVEELPQLLSGETGVALLMHPEVTEDRPELAVIWLQPGIELADKLYDAVGKAAESDDDDLEPTQRNDISLAGQDVMQLFLPSIEVDADKVDLPDMDELELEAWEEEFEARVREAIDNGQVTIEYRTAMVTRFDGLFLAVLSPATMSEEERDELQPKFEEMFARLIAAHAEEEAEFVTAMRTAAGVSEAIELPGEGAIEMLGDLATAVEHTVRSSEQEQASQIAELLGVDNVGPVAVTVSLEGAALHQSVFASLPSPRSGLLRMVEQDTVPFDPPEWIPATAVSYSQTSFALSRAFSVVREEMLNAYPDQFNALMERADGQMQQLIGTTIEELMDSLGDRVVTVGYPLGTRQIDVGDGDELGVPTDRTAIVLEVKSHDVWERVMNAAKRFAALSPSVEPTEEQGYSGLRFDAQGQKGAVVLGDDYLVIAIGDDVLPTTLSVLNEAPAESDALINSELVQRARSLMDVGPAMRNEVVDSNRYLEQYLAFFRRLRSEADEDDEADVVERVLGILMPSEEETKEMFGVTVTAIDVTDDGIHARSVTEFP